MLSDPDAPPARPEAASGLWRSQEMKFLQLHMQREAAHDTIYNLGKAGCVQFRDMNPTVGAFQRLFTNDVRRCEDSERRLRYFEEQLKKVKLDAVAVVDGDQQAETLDTLEASLEAKESELRELTQSYEQLIVELNRCLEHYEVLKQPDAFFRGGDAQEGSASGAAFLDDDASARTGAMKCMTGVINTDRLPTFERHVYRVTRGNAFMRTRECTPDDPFEDPNTGGVVDKTVFVIFVFAARAMDKIRKLCESDQANLYAYPFGHAQEIADGRLKVQENLHHLKTTLLKTRKVRNELLEIAAARMGEWKRTVITEKSVYNVLNMLAFKRHTVQAECWAPESELETVQEALIRGKESSGAQTDSFFNKIATRDTPPTYFKTNKFTGTFQGIVDSYGMARYKEVNPGVLTIVTFPFLFGVMYGDIGHGVCITLVALLMIWKEKELGRANLNEIISMVFGGRYIIVLMGIFAIYMGALYNDFFGLMVSWFDSMWMFRDSHVGECRAGYDMWMGGHPLAEGEMRSCPKPGAHYPFGVDWAWCETENKLDFYNSLKMKMAVILGVSQMEVGLILQLLNHLRYGDSHHIWFAWIPEMIFLAVTFGYMCFMIITKWLTDWTVIMNEATVGNWEGYQVPSLLEMMTNFFLAPFSIEEHQQLYVSATFQNNFQLFLLFLAFISIPWLLLPIPILEYRHHQQAGYGEIGEGGGDAEEGAAHEEEPFDMGEVVIKQIIHTIEYVLGCVSNTASYLRLWALSLAHAELSEVFWNYAWMLPLTAVPSPLGPVGAFVGFAVWAAATLAVLLIMESLSAFLHALRLHWVEFQNKFYYGDGIKFTPYNIEALMPGNNQSDD